MSASNPYDPPEALLQKQSQIMQQPGVHGADLTRPADAWVLRVFGQFDSAARAAITGIASPFSVEFIEQDELPSAYT